MTHKPTTGFSIKTSRFATWLGIVCLAGMIAFSGCSPLPLNERVTAVDFFSSRTEETEEALNIEIFLRPQDSRGRTVEAPGSLDVKLWKQDPSTLEKVEFLNEWTGILVTHESYERNRGARIWLRYYKDQESDTALTPPFILEIAFTLDGKTVVYTKTGLDLGIRYYQPP
ncbi:hypothetical protein ACFLYS_00125 [Chloroflexota bacterium]